MNPKNLALCCLPCNSAKGNMMEHEFRVFLDLRKQITQLMYENDRLQAIIATLKADRTQVMDAK